MSGKRVVIIGATMPESRYWRRQFEGRVPELAGARELSARTPRSAEGQLVTRIYIAPGANRIPGFDEVFTILRRNLGKSGGGADDVVWLTKRESSE